MNMLKKFILAALLVLPANTFAFPRGGEINAAGGRVISGSISMTGGTALIFRHQGEGAPTHRQPLTITSDVNGFVIERNRTFNPGKFSMKFGEGLDMILNDGAFDRTSMFFNSPNNWSFNGFNAAGNQISSLGISDSAYSRTLRDTTTGNVIGTITHGSSYGLSVNDSADGSTTGGFFLNPGSWNLFGTSDAGNTLAQFTGGAGLTSLTVFDGTTFNLVGSMTMQQSNLAMSVENPAGDVKHSYQGNPGSFTINSNDATTGSSTANLFVGANGTTLRTNDSDGSTVGNFNMGPNTMNLSVIDTDGSPTQSLSLNPGGLGLTIVDFTTLNTMFVANFGSGGGMSWTGSDPADGSPLTNFIMGLTGITMSSSDVDSGIIYASLITTNSGVPATDGITIAKFVHDTGEPIGSLHFGADRELRLASGSSSYLSMSSGARTILNNDSTPDGIRLTAQGATIDLGNSGAASIIDMSASSADFELSVVNNSSFSLRAQNSRISMNRDLADGIEIKGNTDDKIQLATDGGILLSSTSVNNTTITAGIILLDGANGDLEVGASIIATDASGNSLAVTSEGIHLDAQSGNLTLTAAAVEIVGDLNISGTCTGCGGGSSPTTTKGDLIVRDASADVRLPVGADGQIVKALASDAEGMTWQDDVKTINFLIDGGGSAITTGVKGTVRIPYGITVTAWHVVADVSGSIVVDVNGIAFGSWAGGSGGPTVASTEKPTLSTAIANSDTSITLWTDPIAADTMLTFEVDSAATVTLVTVSIEFVRN